MYNIKANNNNQIEMKHILIEINKDFMNKKKKI